MMFPLVVLAPLVIGNASLSLEVPKGYKDRLADAAKTSPSLASLGAILLGTDDGLTTINLIPTDYKPDDDLSDASECAAFAIEMKTRIHADASTSAIVVGPRGKTCQIGLTNHTPRPFVTTQTILRGPKDAWMMTCTVVAATASVAARRDCLNAMQSIKFK